MNMSVMPFDTYSYIKELIQGGFSEQQAEANMRALVKAFDFSIDNKLATKVEYQDVVVKLDEFEKKLNEFEKKFATKDELLATKTELKEEILKLDHKIDKVFLKTVITTGLCTGSMLTIACSVMTFLIKF